MFILWKEYIKLVMYIEGQREEALLLLFLGKLAIKLHDSIKIIVQKAERNLAHSTKNDVGTVEVLVQELPDHSSSACASCKREPFSLPSRVANVNAI